MTKFVPGIMSNKVFGNKETICFIIAIFKWFY